MVETTTTAKTRRIPMDELFMGKVDDIFYGFLSLKATYNPNQKELYLTKQNELLARKEYHTMTKVTDRTLRNRVGKMVEYGYLVDKGDRYVFSAESSLWEIVQYDMLKYLVATKSENSVKIYCYLLNKFKWKQSSGEGYSFTLKGIARAIGYSESSSNSSNVTSIIRMIVEDLTRTGIINFVDYYDGKAPKMRLTWVEQDANKLEKVGDGK